MWKGQGPGKRPWQERVKIQDHHLTDIKYYNPAFVSLSYIILTSAISGGGVITRERCWNPFIYMNVSNVHVNHVYDSIFFSPISSTNHKVDGMSKRVWPNFRQAPNFKILDHPWSSCFALLSWFSILYTFPHMTSASARDISRAKHCNRRLLFIRTDRMSNANNVQDTHPT